MKIKTIPAVFAMVTSLVVALPSARASGAVAPASSHLISSTSTTPFVPGEILVKRVERAADEAMARARARVGGKRVKAFPALGVELWRLGPGVAVGRAVAELMREERGRSIEYAEPNWYLFANRTPNDPRFGDLWGLANVGQTGGSADADIDAPEAWGEWTGSASVVIGVIDSGVDYRHEDLAANLWSNDAELHGEPGVDDDGNGYIDDVHGWDFVNDDNDPIDDAGHGTHVAGTIGAVGDNGIGVVGVAWTARLMPLKFLDRAGVGTTDDAVEALLYAHSFGVPITNNSWGGNNKSSTLESAIRAFDGLFVASAGNAGNSRKLYPAGFGLDNILSVAATDDTDRLATFSSRGATWVDLAAPGVEVLSTIPDDGYGWKSGTSMAAPYVAGAAALVLVQHPEWGWAEVRDQILSTVDPLEWLAGLVATGGRLNAAAAVGAPTYPPGGDTIPPAAIADLDVDPAATAHDWVTVTWTAPGDDGASGTAFLYDLRFTTDPAGGTSFDFDAATPVEGVVAPQTAGSEERFTVTGLETEANHFFAIVTVDDAGNRSAISNVASATTGPPPPPEVDCVDGFDNDFDGAVDCADPDCAVAGPPCDPCRNHVCQPGEDCELCPVDCAAPAPTSGCGNGVCEVWAGENCERCPSDCAGIVSGKPSGRFCCGSGQYGVPCSDARCSSGGRQCEEAATATACCGDGFAEPPFETEWSCGIEICAPGTPGADPGLFLVSYFFDWNSAAGITTLAAGSRFNILGTPDVDPAHADVPECRVDCAGNLRAYYKDLLSGGNEGDWGDPVSVDACQASGACCSTATEYGFWVDCCVLP